MKKERNEDLTAKLDELICIIKGKDKTQVNAISKAKVEEVDFIARNSYNPAWKSQNYGSNFQKPYNRAGAPSYNNNNNGANNGNRQPLDDVLKTFINAQTEHNNSILKTVEMHDRTIGQMISRVVVMKHDVQGLQERMKTMEAQMAKIAQSQTLILTQFAGKPEPNPVEDLKMMRGISKEEEMSEELDYSNAPSPDYTIEDLVKIIKMKNPGMEEGNKAAYQQFINQVALTVRELEQDYNKLAENYLLS